MAMSGWQVYPGDQHPGEHTVTGTLRRLEGVHSPQLDNQRDLFVYLPPSYSVSERTYPVLYMHDGQNLFDAPLSFAGEWQVDETMERLSAEGIEAIVVGIPNAGQSRMTEYNPFDHPRFGKGQGDAYLDFVATTVKPIIDRDFRTLPGRDSTGIMGSSMGGLINLYAYFARPDVFGFAGIISPSLGIDKGALYQYVQDAPYTPGKIYMDVGTREINTRADKIMLHLWSRWYCQSVRRMRDLLTNKGYIAGESLLYVEEADGIHNEADWARRLPGALRFLLGTTG